MKSRHVRPIAFVVALIAAAVAQAQEVRTLPLDPLTPQEHETAMRIATAIPDRWSGADAVETLLAGAGRPLWVRLWKSREILLALFPLPND